MLVGGFLSGSRLLFSIITGTASDTYALDMLASEGKKPQPEKIADLSTHLGGLAVSPDGNLVAYRDRQNGAAALNLLGMENGKK